MVNPKSLANLKSFKPGETIHAGGKPVGARNRLQGDFMLALANDFEKEGKRAIVEAREKDPMGYIKVCATLMPKELEVKRTMGEIDDDQLDAAILAVRTVLAASVTGKGESKAVRGKQAQDVRAVPETEGVP